MAAFDPATALQHLYWLKPEILLALVAFLVLGLSVVLPAEARSWIGWFAFVGVVVAGYLVLCYSPATSFGVPKLQGGTAVGAFPDVAGRAAFVLDGFALFFKGLFLFAAALTILSAMGFLAIEQVQGGEFYALVLFAVIGMMLLASGNDFATLYIGLETTALASYVLVGFTRANVRSNEAALKYFVLGAFASAILVYGVSLVYGATGTIHLAAIAEAIGRAPGEAGTLVELGAILILVGLAFKIAAFPFHMWAPDAYEGAPAPVAGFVSTASKAAAFAMILRVYLRGFHQLFDSWTPLLAALSVASMTFGNIAAVRQDNVKRLLAYSSIAQAGYLLLGLIAIGAAQNERTASYGMTAVLVHLLVYTVTNLGAFGLVTLLRRGEVAGDRIDDFRGLSARNPLAAAAMVVFLLSLAGIPCTAGFIGKWWLIGAVIQADLSWLAVVAVVNSAISLFYYARIVVAMYMTPHAAQPRVAVPAPLAAALAIACAFTLWIGVYPSPFIRLAQTALFPLVGR